MHGYQLTYYRKVNNEKKVCRCSVVVETQDYIRTDLEGTSSSTGKCIVQFPYYVVMLRVNEVVYEYRNR